MCDQHNTKNTVFRTDLVHRIRRSITVLLMLCWCSHTESNRDPRITKPL
ncbi:hypothetical protein [Escherichia phage vB_EcoM_EP57]|nr:hypothetical protein [Escherichia phage vB_EcoM_EP57]